MSYFSFHFVLFHFGVTAMNELIFFVLHTITCERKTYVTILENAIEKPSELKRISSLSQQVAIKKVFFLNFLSGKEI